MFVYLFGWSLSVCDELFFFEKPSRKQTQHEKQHKDIQSGKQTRGPIWQHKDKKSFYFLILAEAFYLACKSNQPYFENLPYVKRKQL